MGKIKFVTTSQRIHFQIEVFNPSSQVKIDWWDESGKEECISPRIHKGVYLVYKVEQTHIYKDEQSSHTVTIKGGITWLDIANCGITSIDTTKCSTLLELHCDQNQLTSLDVSKNAMLKWLSCSHNQLTSLNISGCTALETLWCYYNQFSASAMNKIYNDLPSSGGELFCDRLGDYSIAENKGWRAYY